MRSLLRVSVCLMLGSGCASRAAAPAAAGGKAQGAESKDESFAERERERLKREQEGRAIDERREDFIHRQNGRSGE